MLLAYMRANEHTKRYVHFKRPLVSTGSCRSITALIDEIVAAFPSVVPRIKTCLPYVIKVSHSSIFVSLLFSA